VVRLQLLRRQVIQLRLQKVLRQYFLPLHLTVVDLVTVLTLVPLQIVTVGLEAVLAVAAQYLTLERLLLGKVTMVVKPGVLMLAVAVAGLAV
jgi:hypothetical protein